MVFLQLPLSGNAGMLGGTSAGHYKLKSTLIVGGGKFNLSNPKTDVEWRMIRAAQIPGPGAYEV